MGRAGINSRARRLSLVFPFGRSELRQKYILPHKPFLSCKVVSYPVIVV